MGNNASVEKEKLELEKKKIELDEKERKLIAENSKKKMELEEEAYRLENENRKRQMELEYEARKRDIDLRTEESKRNYELQRRKADIEHQHKIAELIAQMKQTKLQAGKELVFTYMKTINMIIDQDNERLPEPIKNTIQNAINKAFMGYMNTQELLDYTKHQVNDLQLKQDDEFTRLLGFAVDQELITEKNKLYILE
ncbi:33151_t:CDS:2 [Gigaspora margarita]|uniref:33151_t:CDS:1 n=1 Tax=Gigaspora margarita TaxID=4874 RepID=A0ABN7VWM6_GIGMA|nr:33151_t:CDS:2 [Gigaspora margarita]